MSITRAQASCISKRKTAGNTGPRNITWHRLKWGTIRSRFCSLIMSLTLILVTGITIFPGTSLALSGLSVRQLLTQCLNDNDYLESDTSACQFYIVGYVSAIRQYDLGGDFCVDDTGFQVDDIRKEFVHWAIFHSEEYDASASAALAKLIGQLYACDK